MKENACKVVTIVPPASSLDSDRTCILVLGMHRSGTSAFTRMLNLLGADLPSGLMPSTSVNPTGYWEATELMGIHEELLACSSSSWDDWKPFSISAESKIFQRASLARLRAWIEREFGKSQLFIVKDPRICRFVPLWLETLESLSCQPRIVLPVRHPIEVAESLFARDGMSVSKGCLLWLRHVLDAEQATRHLPRAFVHYDDLLKDWSAVATCIASQLTLSLPRPTEEAAIEISNFLSAKLRHHISSPQELALRSDVAEWVRRTYTAVCGLISDGQLDTHWRELDRVRNEFDTACLAFGELIYAEREDSAQQALKEVTVITRREFDERVVSLESRISHCETFLEDHRVPTVSAESSEGQGQNGSVGTPQVVAKLLSSRIAEPLGKKLAVSNPRIDELVSVAEQHQAQLSTLGAELQHAMSRFEGEIAGTASHIEQLRNHVVSHETITELLYQETRRLDEVSKKITDSSLEQERSTAGQIGLLRSDLDVVKAGIEEMRLTWADTRAQLELFQRDLKRVREESFAQQLKKLFEFTKPLKRAIQRGCHAVIGLVTLRWVRDWSYARRLPHYQNQLLSTGLFDPTWFLQQNPDVAAAGVDPLHHWLTYGVHEGRKPNPEFDPHWYLARYPRVAKSGRNPLVHYLRKGASPGINPNPHFDGAGYLSEHPEVAKAKLNPLAHYLKSRSLEHVELSDALSPADGSPSVQESEPFEPLVTVVVPNFNHSQFLPRRLDSIYNQTYRNFRVILLDDCSSDNSRAILDEYKNRYPEITTCNYNEKNSGGVFRQWRKAIQLASGSPLLWIAESDDYCDDDFLEKLVPSFRDETVMLAYSRVQFVDPEGLPHPFTFRDHLSPHIDTSHWSQDHVAVSHREVESAFAIKNIVPNVSGAVLRTPASDWALLEDESWQNMKICGDWVLYLHLLAGGKLAYCARTANYFRVHSANSSRETHREEVYYREHARVSEEAARLYRVSDRTLGLAREVTREYYNAMVGGGDAFDKLFDSNKIAQAKANRSPTIVISLFSFVTGGGEIIPIRLANELKRRGCAVVVHCLDHFHDQPGVRAMLRNDIPVVRANTTEQILKMLAEVDPDIINTHHKSIQGKFLEIAQDCPAAFASCRHVATMHGMFEMSEYFSEEYLDEALPKYIKSVDSWIYTADKNIKPFEARELFDPLSFKKISNGIEKPKIRSIARSDLGIEPEAFVLCEASRAIPEKGWREAIDAVTQAANNCTRPIHLLLLGTGPVFDELSEQTLPPNVHLLGHTDDSCSYYAMSDMAILPSTFSGESFPMTLVEALSVGKPVIASDIGEIRAMLSSESGVAGALIPIVDGKVSVDLLSTLIVCFAQDAQVYKEACAVTSTLAKRFDVREIAEQYLEVFAKTTKRSARKPQILAGETSVPSLFVQTEQLREMELFDAQFYRQQYLDIADLRDPLAHYVFYGCREQRMPNDWFDLQYLRQSCPELLETSANPLWYYGMFLKDKKQVKTRSDMRRWGYCPVCEQQRLFLAHFDTDDSFNDLRCISCNGAPRDRALAHLLDSYLPGWRGTARIHESSPCTPCLKMLAGDYSASHYYPDKRPGAIVNGFRNENIEKLTFEDNAFDVVAALEVIEHVFDPAAMVREMVRCTRPGGIAAFTTVPGGIPVSRPRARIDSTTGQVEHLFPPVYHGNPIGDGSLLTWDFGLDFDDNIRSWSGGAELIHWSEENEDIGIIRDGVPHIYLLKKPFS